MRLPRFSLPQFSPTFYGLGLVLVVLAIIAPALPTRSVTARPRSIYRRSRVSPSAEPPVSSSHSGSGS